MNIINPDRPHKFGKTRSEQERNLRREGMATMTNEQLDKCRYLERAHGNRLFFDKREIDSVV